MKLINPKTIILNPDISLILNRLNSRREKGKRKLRDELCFREDNINHVGKMHRLFENYYSNENILHVKDNDENSINLIYNWLNKF